MKRLLAILLTLTTFGCLGLSGCKKRQAIGKFYTLQEAFDQGFLTENDLKSIAYYNNGGRENNEDKIEGDFVPQPLIPEKISADLQKSIKSDYIYYGMDLNNTNNESKITIKRYYGKYNGCYVMTIKGPNEYIAAMIKIQVDGYNFSYTQSEFWVWRKK